MAESPKKEGFLSKILHRRSSSTKQEDETPSRSQYDAIADTRSEQMNTVNERKGGSLAMGMPQDRNGNFVLVNHGADPHASLRR